jgi:hypothetical protein
MVPGSVSPAVSFDSDQGKSSVLVTGRHRINGSQLTSEPSVTDDSTAFALRDETTGLIMGLPFTNDLDMFQFGNDGGFSK